MSSPLPTTDKIYSFKEFEFLSLPHKKWVNRSIDFDISIGTINDIPLDQKSFDKLIEISERSEVGVGSETIYDDDIRSSNEITADQIQLNPEFLALISDYASKMAIELEHSMPVKPVLYKLVLYAYGDKFDDHIDNTHSDDMVMTLCVELPRGDEIKGGDLSINGETIPSPEKNQLSLTLFYHDQIHAVSEVKNGRRMSLVFDVIQTNQLLQNVISPYIKPFFEGVIKLKEKGVKRIGFLLEHLYISSDGVRGNQLKGIDKIVYELSSQLKDLMIESVCYNGSEWYFEALIPIMKLEQPFDELFYHHEYENEDSKPINVQNQNREDSYDNIKLNLDKENEYRALNPKYLMGDVVLLKTRAESRIKYKGSEEAYLGNYGFCGKIYSNLALIASI